MIKLVHIGYKKSDFQSENRFFYKSEIYTLTVQPKVSSASLF
jgi:hypothetical protein